METDVATVRGWLDQGSDDQGVPIFLVDCREPEEFQTCSLPGAQLVPLSTWPPTPEVQSAIQGKRVVVYCHHGGRSLRAARWFQHNGFPDALSMAGGIDLWSQVIDPSVPRY
jgi:rhodanese-related sulfurtransferase